MIPFSTSYLKFIACVFTTLACLDCSYAQVQYYVPNKTPQEINEKDSEDEQAIVRTIQNQLQAIREGNLKKAYDFTSAEFRNVTTPEDFAEFVASYPVFSKNKNINRQNLFLRKVKIGTFEGSLEGPDGSNLRVEYNLIRENNDWKIIGIKLYHPGEMPKLPMTAPLPSGPQMQPTIQPLPHTAPAATPTTMQKPAALTQPQPQPQPQTLPHQIVEPQQLIIPQQMQHPALPTSQYHLPTQAQLQQLQQYRQIQQMPSPTIQQYPTIPQSPPQMQQPSVQPQLYPAPVVPSNAQQPVFQPAITSPHTPSG
jgi:hypothetical protein